MAVKEDEKYFPYRISWLILNKLSEFNDKPQLIEDLAEKFEKLTSHTLFYTFAPLYREAMVFYNEQGYFPDVVYLNSRFPAGRMIELIDGIQFSMHLYDKLLKQLDYEILIQNFTVKIGDSDFIDIESCKELGKKLVEFATTNIEIPLDVKTDWVNSYRNAVQEYHGVSTGIKILDEQVGTMSGITTIAAPSGNGKSTMALSLAYNIATHKSPKTGCGGNVLYISFEMTKFQLQANIVSIESSFSESTSDRLKASDIKEFNLKDHEVDTYEKHMINFMKRLNYSGGYLALVDNTSMTGYNTIEGFITSIENLSEKLNKKFDIIFIDNVDSLKVLKGDRGQDEMAKMNSFITKLDAFSKTYMNGYGTTIVLLSQTNRDGFKKLKAMEASGTQEITIDYTVLQQYSALYERATMVLVLYSSALMRANNQLKLMPVKLRNKPLPHQPISLATRWDFSYVGGSYRPPKMTENDITEIIDSISDTDLEDDFEILTDDDFNRINSTDEIEDISYEEAGAEEYEEQVDIPPLD